MPEAARKVHVAEARAQICAECCEHFLAVFPEFTLEQMLEHARRHAILEAQITITCGCPPEINPSRTWEQARADWMANLHPDEIVYLGEDRLVYVAETAEF